MHLSVDYILKTDFASLECSAYPSYSLCIKKSNRELEKCSCTCMLTCMQHYQSIVMPIRRKTLIKKDIFKVKPKLLICACV